MSKLNLEPIAHRLYQAPVASLAAGELQAVLAEAVMGRIAPAWERCRQKAGRRVYYLSAEYLLGRLWDNNLLNTGLWEEAHAALVAAGADPARLEEIEDAALGNGGLGRLAACFLDAAATKGIPLDGYGIRYRYGLFKQTFADGFQQESPDHWTRLGDPWSVRREQEAVTVALKSGTVRAIPYDYPVIGYGGKQVRTLRLWQAEPMSPFDFDAFNRQHYQKAVAEKTRAEDLSRVLYPNDSTPAGKVLRLSQQYFFASASVQDLLRRFEQDHGPVWKRLPEQVAVQLNDTHPVIAIPELTWRLNGRGVPFDKAADIATRVFNYTNHTVMAEALETWDIAVWRRVCPHLIPVVRRLNRRFFRELNAFEIPSDTRTHLDIVRDEQVHMAHLACRYSTRINGVAPLHTEILQNRVLRAWQDLYPNKILNVTNGITPRRWLLLANPALSGLVTELLGDERWITDLDRLSALASYADDHGVMERFAAIKQANKHRLAQEIARREGILINPNALFDVQIKRMHEYKRQLLNILCVLELYFEIREGSLNEFPPTLFLFGGKAAPGYARAKGVIKLIHEVSRLISADPVVREVLQVVFVTDYNVSYAQHIIPAADVSEQISTAGTEASGTGNMKMMLNGAVTLGTYDGANIQIVEAAGEENNYIFGARVEDLPDPAEYRPRALYEADPRLKRCLDALVDGTLEDDGTGLFRELYDALLEGAHWHTPDHYYVLGDFAACLQAKKQVAEDWRDRREAFVQKQWRNLCAAGPFSADRAVEEYAKEIWGL